MNGTKSATISVQRQNFAGWTEKERTRAKGGGDMFALAGPLYMSRLWWDTAGLVLRGNEEVGGWKTGRLGQETLSADGKTSDAEGQGKSCCQPELTLSLGAATRNHFLSRSEAFLARSHGVSPVTVSRHTHEAAPDAGYSSRGI